MLFWLSEAVRIRGFQAVWSCSVDFPHYGDHFFGWNWSYLWFLDIIWRTCGSKCQREGGGIFPTLCVECCLVYVFFFLCFSWLDPRTIARSTFTGSMGLTSSFSQKWQPTMWAAPHSNPCKKTVDTAWSSITASADALDLMVLDHQHVWKLLHR